jgi:hypothetical protein
VLFVESFSFLCKERRNVAAALITRTDSKDLDIN